MVTITITKRHLYALAVLLLALTVVVPVGVWAADRFTDVPESNTFHDDIVWLADAGITKGCNPPANTEFCPDDFVTRGQMSAFMNRFAGFLGAQDGIVSQADNANTLDGIDSSGFVTEDRLSAAIIFNGSAAIVNTNGVNDAVSVNRLSTGYYEVFFDRNVLGCVTTGNSGFMRPQTSGGSWNFGAVVSTFMPTAGDRLLVRTYSPETGLIDSSFLLDVACPAQEIQPLSNTPGGEPDRTPDQNGTVTVP